MAKSQTPKSRYPSRYSDSFITIQQYITEILCELTAKQDNKRLPFKFWELPEWNKLYRRYIADCNKFLKKYSAEVILETLKDNRIQHSKCRSFYFPPFIKLLDENKKREKEIKTKYNPPTHIQPISQTTKPITDITSRKTQSVLDKLRDL